MRQSNVWKSYRSGQQCDDSFTARLFSPSEELPEYSERDQEEAQVSELNRLFFETQEN
jgi:hypothetical protein